MSRIRDTEDSLILMLCNNRRNWNLEICEREKQGVSDGSRLVVVRQMRHTCEEQVNRAGQGVLIGGNTLGGLSRMRIELF